MDKLTLLREGLRRVRTAASESAYVRSGVDLTAPAAIQGLVNERCNYACRYCHFWRLDRYATELTLEEWQRALASLRDFIGRYVIQFAGGEPFLKQGFVELLAFCRREGIDWGVITNGSAFRSEAVVAKVVAARPMNVDVSVDAADAPTHDHIRGAPGSLRALEAGLALLRRERARGGRHFPIRITPTVSRLNVRALPALADWAAEHADSIDFHPVHALPFWTDAMRRELWPDDEAIAALREAVETLIAKQATGAPIETPAHKLRSFPEQFLGRRVQTGVAGPCRTGMRDYIITANGDVVVCWDYPPIGNVRRQGARQIWRGAQARAVRARTIVCPKLGKECANSCLDHRSLLQDVRRAVKLLARRAT